MREYLLVQQDGYARLQTPFEAEGFRGASPPDPLSGAERGREWRVGGTQLHLAG